MSISTWDRVHFWIYLLNHHTWPSDRYASKVNTFQNHLNIWRTGAQFQILFNLANCSNYSITSYVKTPVFHFFKKIDKCQLLKVTRSCYICFNKMIKGPGNTFQSTALSQKHVTNICHTAHQYLTKFYLIVLRIQKK